MLLCNIPVLAKSGTGELWLICEFVRVGSIAGLLINILPPKKQALLAKNIKQRTTDQPKSDLCSQGGLGASGAVT